MSQYTPGPNDAPRSGDSAAPGWYPVDERTQRYWDGNNWTPHTAPRSSSEASSAQRPTQATQAMPQYYSPATSGVSTPSLTQGSWFGRHKVLTGLLAVVLLFVLIGIVGSINKSPTSTPVSGSPASATSSAPAVTAATTPSATPSPEAPSPTSAEQQTAFEAKFGQTVAVQDETLFGSDKGNAEYTVSAPVDVPADKFNTPKFGKFVALVVSVKNNSDKTFPVNPFYFSIETADGQKNNTTEFFMDPPKGLPADLSSSEVRPGGVAKGTIIFDVPKSNDWHLVVSNSALRDAAAWGF